MASKFLSKTAEDNFRAFNDRDNRLYSRSEICNLLTVQVALWALKNAKLSGRYTVETLRDNLYIEVTQGILASFIEEFPILRWDDRVGDRYVWFQSRVRLFCEAFSKKSSKIPKAFWAYFILLNARARSGLRTRDKRFRETLQDDRP
jgi:hypothetical protein